MPGVQLPAWQAGKLQTLIVWTSIRLGGIVFVKAFCFKQQIFGFQKWPATFKNELGFTWRKKQKGKVWGTKAKGNLSSKQIDILQGGQLAIRLGFKRSRCSTQFPKSAYKAAWIPCQWFDHHASRVKIHLIYSCTTIHMCMWLYRISVCCHSDAPNWSLTIPSSHFSADFQHHRLVVATTTPTKSNVSYSTATKIGNTSKPMPKNPPPKPVLQPPIHCNKGYSSLHNERKGSVQHQFLCRPLRDLFHRCFFNPIARENALSHIGFQKK